jgi:hypothetical protein
VTLTTSMDPRVKLADPVRMTGRAARARPRHYGTHTLRRTKAKRSYLVPPPYKNGSYLSATRRIQAVEHVLGSGFAYQPNGIR